MTAFAAFLPLIGPDVPGCPNFTMEDALLRAAIRFCEEAKWTTETVAITTSADTAAYAIAVTAGTRAFSIEALIYDEWPLDKTDRMHVLDWTETGPPEAYYLDSSSQLVLAPTPDTAYDLSLLVVTKPTRTATTLSDSLYDEWADALAHGAKAILMEVPGKAWSNAPGAAYHEAKFAAEITKAGLYAEKGRVVTPLRISPMEI